MDLLSPDRRRSSVIFCVLVFFRLCPGPLISFCVLFLVDLTHTPSSVCRPSLIPTLHTLMGTLAPSIMEISENWRAYVVHTWFHLRGAELTINLFRFSSLFSPCSIPNNPSAQGLAKSSQYLYSRTFMKEKKPTRWSSWGLHWVALN